MAKFDAFLIAGIAVIGVILIKKLADQQTVSVDQTQSDYTPYPSDTSYQPDYTYPTMTEPTPPQSAVLQTASIYTTSPQGVQNIANWEGKSYSAYRDIAGNLTIGRGHLIKPGDGLTAQSVLNDQQIENLFDNDIADAETSVKSRVIAPLTQGQFDALVDFVFQFGDGKFATSTLLQLLNKRQYDLAAAEFAKWVHANNQVVSQLVVRRQADTQIFYA